MKKFIKEITVYILVLLLISIIGQVIVDSRIKDRTVRGHDNIDVVKDQDNGLVFLGSSRCWVHFDPLLFEKGLGMKAVNLGVDGHSELSMPIIRLKDYLEKNKAPKEVILNFDPFVQAGSFDKNTNFVHKNDFARYAYNCPKDDELFANYFRFDFFERHIPLYALLKYKLFFDCLTLKNVSAWAKYGYEKHDESWDTVSNPVKTDHIKDYFDTTASALDELKGRLDSLNTLCKQNNIKLICVQTPVYKAIYVKRYFSLTGQICDDLKIPFFDLNRDSIDDNIDLFYNSNHLNTAGVRAMTSNLLSDPDFLQIVRSPL
ncbi:MAG TPA: hypothetical protein VIH61_08785 [Waddliaceae bacterium]